MRVIKCEKCEERMCRLYFQTHGQWMGTSAYACPKCGRILRLVEV